ncbi:RAN GTPase-activating protein 2 [Phytophthora cinnamomi]|uniref:RAN GTPase-activating protein 2 n=1 Tax=Phytophthora cinnamomi TaxID=4785 RepID=UPI003559659C|nr:RAN GTPase-activating protein 2 [Phytophthora cinnamomi]
MRDLHAVTSTLLTLAWIFLLVVPGTLSADDPVQLSESFGGPHGNAFSDQASVAAGQTIASLTIRAGERVDGVSLEVKGPTAATFSHGGTGGRPNTLTLAADEHITSMEAHWGEKKGRTRIFYLSFGTSAGNKVSGGSQTDSKNTVKAPEGFQLGGFFGQDGDEIDKLGAIWTRISAEAPATEAPATEAPTPAPTPAPAAPVPSTAGSASAASGETSADKSSAGSADASAPASAESSTDASGSATEVAKPKKTGKRPTTSTEDSASGSDASADANTDVSASGSAAEVARPKKTGKRPTSSGPKKTGKRPTTSTEDSASGSNASADANTDVSASGSAAEVARPKKTGKRPTASADESASENTSSTESASGSAGKVAKSKKKGKGLAVPTEASAESGKASKTASADASAATSSASESASKDSSAATSTELSASGSTEPTSTDASTTSSSGGSAPGSGADALAPSASASAAPAPAPAPTPAPTPAAPTMSVKDSVQLSESFGGPHGMDFSDKNFVNSGQTVSSISIHAGERLDGITLQISAPKSLTFTHGGTGGDQKTLKLEPGEFIKSMEVHWGKKNDHTRIFYVNFVTSKGNSLAGGSMTNDKNTVTAPEGFQLAGFFGKDGKEIDTLGAVWAYIDLVTPAPTPAPAPVKDEDSPGTVAPPTLQEVCRR